MGCFDTINFKCPECGNKMQTQTKCGPCCMMEVDIESVPIELIDGLEDQGPLYCEKCGGMWKFKTPDAARTVKLEVIRYTDR